MSQFKTGQAKVLSATPNKVVLTGAVSQATVRWSPETLAKRGRAIAAAHARRRPEISVDWTCARCGGVQRMLDSRAKHRVYCGEACQALAARDAYRAGALRPCEVCGIPFYAKASRSRARFCSYRCRGLAMRRETHPRYGASPCHTRRSVVSEGVLVRSSWEALVAAHLTALGLAWRYEDRRYKLSAIGATYCPDFSIYDVAGRLEKHIEVKGWWTPVAIEKIKTFRSAYPAVPLEVWDHARLIALGLVDRKGRPLAREIA